MLQQLSARASTQANGRAGATELLHLERPGLCRYLVTWQASSARPVLAPRINFIVPNGSAIARGTADGTGGTSTYTHARGSFTIGGSLPINRASSIHTYTDNRIRLPAGAHRASALATHQSSGSGLTRAAADDRIRPTPSAAVRRNRGSQTDEPTGDLAYEARRFCTVRVMLCRRPVESGWPSAHSRSGRSAWSAARPVAAGTPSRHRRHGERFDSERRIVDVMAICPGRTRRRLPPSARPRGSERW